MQEEVKLLLEAILMSGLKHPHIVQVMGITDTRPLMLVMEFLENGELRTFLRAPTTRQGTALVQLVGVARQICDAVAFLILEKNVLHRDIAAR